MAHGNDPAPLRSLPRFLPRFLARMVLGASMAAAAGAQAAPFELVYTGTFNSQEALTPASQPGPAYFAGATPFTIHALFNDSSPNLAPSFGGPFNGFRAYAPSSATIDIQGVRFTIASILDNASAGVTVAIFDRNSFTPGRYGIGLLAHPVGDGAGVIGDFTSALPNFTAGALTPTVFTDYFGVGHGSGVCLSGTPPACPHANTPWVLHDSGNTAWNLLLGNFDEDYPVAHSPGALIGPLNTAQLLAGVEPPLQVPEPPALALMLLALTGLAGAGCRQLRRASAT